MYNDNYDDINKYKSELNNKDIEVNKYKSELNNKDIEVNKYKSELNKKDILINELTNINKNYKKVIYEINNYINKENIN